MSVMYKSLSNFKKIVTTVILGILIWSHPMMAQSFDDVPDLAQPNENVARIMILGTFHFTDQGSDSYNPQHNIDILSEARQAQVIELVQLLEKYIPNKIAVEVKTDRQTHLDSLYKAYLSGTHELQSDEVYQLGFRLARLLDHEKVYAVDAMGRSFFADMTQEEYDARVRKLDHADLQINVWHNQYKELKIYEDSLKMRHSLREFLFYRNSEERIQKEHGKYLVDSFKLSAGDDYFGPDMATGVYNRNLRIFSNLQRITTSTNDKILLIIGAGHVPTIRHAVQCSPEYKLVEVNEYLQKDSVQPDSANVNQTNNILDDHLKEINLPYDSITAMTFDGSGGIWIGSKNGLWVLDNNLLREYTYKDGLFDKDIHDLYYSSAGQIWVATSGGPFALLENHFYVFEPLKNQKILRISENASNWLFLTEQGLKIFKKDQSFFDSLYIKITAMTLIIILLSALIFLGIKKFKTNVEWKANLIRVEQQVLLAQMNPHFIFNSLNSVQKYIMVNDSESAHNYLQKFAGMMRKVLENSSQPTITVSEEIETLRMYLELESLRFDNGFDFEITVADDDIWQYEIPTMLIHTFVENAVWHGLMNKESRGKISLRFSKANKKTISCEIEDNGIGLKKAAEYKSKERIRHKSKGTEIVKKRIELLNLKARQKIKCETIDLGENNTQRTGTLVRMEIPVTLG